MKSAAFALLLSALILSGCDTFRPAGSAEGSSGGVNGTAGLGMKF
jgi:PBP1b-binding outer membrane lipoprotein LpoB